METPDRVDLAQRVDRLERELAEVKALLEWMAPWARTQEQAPPSQTPPTPPPPPHPQTQPARPTPVPAPARPGFELPEYMRRSEFWLSRVGIGLVLFGLVFAFKYSIDQGWITPPVRHYFGIGLGVLLFILGWRLYSRRLHLSRLLLGGSVAAFYITAYSAFQLFHLISHPVAFALMVLVTCLAFFVALKQNDALFSIIGTLGGLGTPFMLYTESGSVPALVLYTCLLLTGTLAVYFFKGWRALLWLSAIGGWIVLLTGLEAAEALLAVDQASARWSLQIGILFTWLGFGALPTVRKNSRWQAAAAARDESHVHVLAVGSPLVALGLSLQCWPETSEPTFGWAALLAAIGYGAIAWLVRRTEAVKPLAFTFALTAAVLLTLALSLLLDGDTLYVALAAEALALHLLARRLNDQLVFGGANLLSAIVGAWFLVNLAIIDSESPALVNARALCDLWVILCGVVVALNGFSRPARLGYGLAAHLGFLIWLARELGHLDNGQGYLSIAWGTYGALLLVIALRRNLEVLRWVGLVTLMLMVGKLFVIDLAELETIWRVLLFMGFGAVFLLLSYFFPRLWRGRIET